MRGSYNDTVLSYLNVAAYRSGIYYRALADEDIVAHLDRMVQKIANKIHL